MVVVVADDSSSNVLLNVSSQQLHNECGNYIPYGRQFSGRRGGGLFSWKNQGKPSELIFMLLNFVIAIQSRGAVLCNVI